MVFLLLLLIFGFYSFAPTIGDGCSGDSGIGNPTTCEYINQEQDPSSGSNSGSGSGTGSPQGGSGGNINPLSSCNAYDLTSLQNALQSPSCVVVNVVNDIASNNLVTITSSTGTNKIVQGNGNTISNIVFNKVSDNFEVDNLILIKGGIRASYSIGRIIINRVHFYDSYINIWDHGPFEITNSNFTSISYIELSNTSGYIENISFTNVNTSRNLIRILYYSSPPGVGSNQIRMKNISFINVTSTSSDGGIHVFYYSFGYGQIWRYCTSIENILVLNSSMNSLIYAKSEDINDELCINVLYGEINSSRFTNGIVVVEKYLHELKIHNLKIYEVLGRLLYQLYQGYRIYILNLSSNIINVNTSSNIIDVSKVHIFHMYNNFVNAEKSNSNVVYVFECTGGINNCNIYNNSFHNYKNYLFYLTSGGTYRIYNNYILTPYSNKVGYGQSILFYNNYVVVNYTNDIEIVAMTNSYLNTSRQPGPSIINTPEIGGNCWSNISLTHGPCYTCTDANNDGFCDQPFQPNSYSSLIDLLPLRYMALNDNIPPDVNVTNPGNRVTTSSVDVNVNFNLWDDMMISRYEVYLNGSLVPNNAPSSITNGTYSYLFQNLGPGVYSVRVVVYDLMNNSDSDSVTFVVYGVPGSSNGNNGTNGNSSYSVRGNFSSNVSNNDYWIDLRLDSAISWNVTLVVDGNDVNSSVGSGSSNVSLGYTHPVSRNSTYRFRVNYSVGGSSVVVVYGPYNAYVDFVAPDVNVTNPGNRVTTSSVDVNVSFNLWDDMMISRYEVYLNGSLVPNNAPSSITNGTYSYLFQNLGPGVYSVRVVVYDLMNNSDSDSVTFVVYGVPGSSNGNNGTNGNSSYSVRGNFSSNVSNNDYWIDLRLDSAISWNVTLVVDGNDVNSSVGSGSSNVSLGYTHPVSRNSTYGFRVNYSVGGSSVVAVYGPYNAYVDFVAPDVNVTNPGNRVTTSSVDVNVSFNLWDDMVISRYEVYLNGSLVPNNAPSSITNGTYSYLFQNLGPGVYSVRVVVYDLMNNSDSDSVTFVVYGVPGDDGSSGSGGSSITFDIDPTSNSSNNSYGVNISVNESVNWVIELIVNGNVVDQIQGNGSSVITLNYTYPASGNYTIQFNVTYTVNGDSVTITYGPYNVWIDLIPPTLNISWPRPGESYTEGIRTFEFYVEDDFAQVLTCSYLFTGPNTYNNTVQVQNGSTYSINLEFSRGNYYINVECSDGVNSVVESYQFNIRRSGGNEQPPQDESPPQQQETPPTDQQNQSSTDQNVTTGTIETDSNTTITNIDLNTSTEITTDSSTSDQEQPTPSSIIIQDQSNRGRTTVETEQSSETNQQIVIIPDMEGSDRNINLERSDAETDSNNQQVQSNTELKEDSTDRNNLMNVNRVINSVAVILTSPQSLAGLLGVGVSIILLMLRTVKLTIVRGERNMILLKNLFNKPVKGVTVRILDKEFQSDENGMVVTDLPVDKVEVKGIWIVIRSN